MTKDKLNTLHIDLTKVLADAVANGVPLKDDKTGEIIIAPASASILNIARQFLKDNNMSSTEFSLDTGDTGITELPIFSDLDIPTSIN